MIDGKFDVVFRGQTIKSIALEEVKSNLVGLFKSSPEAVEKLFSGSEVTIKKALDYSTAMKYQSVLKKAGALALIKEVVQESTAPVQTQGRATFGDNSQGSGQEQSSQTRSAPVQVTTQSTEHISVSDNSAASAPTVDQDMTLAAVGSALMPDKVYEKRDVDTSELSLAATGEPIMPKKAPEVAPKISLDHLKLE